MSKINLMTTAEFAEELQEQIQGGASVSDIMYMLQLWSEKEDFESVTRPVLKYLCENYNPHTKVVITHTTAELFEGKKSIGKVMDYVQD